MKCVKCRVNAATVPDREYGGLGRQKKKFCEECHGELLKEDLRVILAKHRREHGSDR